MKGRAASWTTATVASGAAARARLTESDRTARWFGPWKGDAARGHMIKIQMGFEDQAPWLDKRIDACDPPRRLALSNESGNMRIELLLSHTDGLTELRLVHHPVSNVAGKVREMEALHATAALFRSHPHYAAPARIGDKIKALLDAGSLELLREGAG